MAAPYLRRVPLHQKETLMVLHKVRIVFVATLMAMAVDRASAATAIEYGLIAALIALAIMVGARAVGTSLDALFNDVATELDNR